jgi:hypothetical protein
VALALAACGSSTAASTSTTSTPTGGATTTTVPANNNGSNGTDAGASRRAAMQAWRTCLTSHGVNLPTTTTAAPGATPGSGPRFGGGFSTINSILQDPANASAVAACKSLQPTFGQANPALRAAYQAYLSCLSDNGVAIPTTTSGTTPQPRVTINTSDPNYAAANAKCKVLLPNRNGTPGSTSTTAGG